MSVNEYLCPICKVHLMDCCIMCMCGKCSGQTSHSVYKYSDNCS